MGHGSEGRGGGVGDFVRLLGAGQREDWRSGAVVALVIAGMLVTPLALASAGRRAHAAAWERIDRERDVREIVLHRRQAGSPALDDRLIAAIETRLPGVTAVGSHRVVVRVAGPEGSELLPLQTLAAGDPRAARLGIVPGLERGLGLTELVVSDALGGLLYGEAWEGWWRSGSFRGPDLSLAVNDRPLAPAFRVVARRRLAGRGLHGSAAAGAALRRYTEGRGAPELGLPAEGRHSRRSSGRTEYDEVLIYAPRPARVEPAARYLSARYPALGVRYHAGALARLERQRERWSALRVASLALAGAVAATVPAILGGVEAGRRRRRSAHLVARGRSRAFVRRLAVAGELLPVLAGAAAAPLLTPLLGAAARRLAGAGSGAADPGLELLLAPPIDPTAWIPGLAAVALCAGSVAVLNGLRGMPGERRAAAPGQNISIE